MGLTDQTLDPIVSEEFSSHRALARHRSATLPDAEPNDGVPEVTEAEQEALLAEFLATPEAAGIKPESDTADIVYSAIGFAAGYVDGRPLRWSPVTVELFLSDWLPRKVVADDEYFAAAPDALTAWVRFASRKRELPTEALDQVLAAIPVYAKELEAALAEPTGAGGPARELFTALEEAGIDPTDEEALQTFTAGWNARSALD